MGTGLANSETLQDRQGPWALSDAFVDGLSGFVIDAPVRLGFVVVGVRAALRCTNGRVLLALALTFLALPIVFAFVDMPLVEWVFTATFPWSHAWRLVLVEALVLAVLGGAGLVAAAERVASDGR